jgi:PAS domain S-box-containing protein
MDTASSAINKGGIRFGGWFFFLVACWTFLFAGLVGWESFELYHETEQSDIFILLVSYAGIWVAGVLGIRLFRNRVRMHLSNLERTKEALRESEALQSTLLENLPIGIVIVNPHTRIIERVSAHTASLFGAPKEEIVGHRCHKFLCPAEECACPICDLGMEVDHSEKVLLRADGSSIPILKTVKRFRYNGEEKLLETFVDISAQKKAEEAIRESDLRHRLLFEKSPDAYVIMDNGVIIDCNEAALALVRSTREQVIGKTSAILAPERQPDGTISSELAAKRRNEAMTSGGTRFEWLHRCPDGSEIWLDTSLSVMQSNGRPLMLCTCRDITQRKTMEEALLESENKYRGLFEYSHDAIMVLESPSWRFTSANPATLQMFNAESVQHFTSYRPDELSPESQPDGRNSTEKALESIETALRVGFHEFEWTHKRIDGEEFPATVLLTKMEHGGKTVLQATVRDITAQKQAEEELRASESRLRSITDWAHDGILMMDPHGAITYWNPAAKSILGYGSEEVLGHNLHELLAPDRYQEAHRSAFPMFVHTGKGNVVGKTVELMARHKDGREIAVAISLSGVMINDAWHAVGILHDITERKEMERHQDLAAAILRILNDPLDFSESINGILSAIKVKMGFEEVGIRLQNGDEFPYFSQNSFSEDYAHVEDSLDARRSLCGLGMTPDGTRRLECTCGLVISGRIDPTNPLFTTNGSFWTNNASSLIGLSAELDPRTNPRNVCLREGFHSVALIPIRANQEIVGLLRLSDRKKGCFTLEMIQFFESVSASIGVALERKHAEEALRESEDKFRTHVEYAFDVIFTLDKVGTFLFVSPAFERLLGYPVNDVVGKPFMQFVHPDDTLPLFEYLSHILDASQNASSPTYRVRHADGDWRWFEASGRRYVDANGEVQFIGVGRDITDRKLTEEALRISQIKYKTLYDSSLDAIVLSSGGTTWLSGNPAAVSLFRCRDLAEFLSNGPVSLSPEFQPDGILSATKARQMRNIALQGGSHQFEWKFRRMDGSEFMSSVLMNKMELEGQTVTISSIRDITNQKIAEERLRESERFLQATVDAISAHIAILDKNGTIIAVNEAWHAFARANAENTDILCEGANYLAVCDAAEKQGSQEAADIAAGIRSVLENRQSEFLFEYACHSPSEERWFMGKVTRFSGEGETHLVIAHMNITERKRAESELQWKTTFLEAQMNSSLDGILVVDDQNKKLLMNQQFCRQCNAPEHILAETDEQSLLHHFANLTNDPKEFINKVHSLYGRPYDTSHDVIEFKNGMILTRHSVPLRGKNGHYYGRMWTFRDVTLQKQSERALSREAIRYHAIMEASTDGICILNSDGYMQECNESFHSKLGYTREEVKSLRVSDWNAKGGSNEIMEVVRSKTHEGTTFQTTHRRKDGSLMDVEINVTPITLDGKSLFVNSVRDITVQKQREQELHDSRAKLATVIDAAQDAIIMLDEEENIVLWSESAVRIFGYSTEEALGRNVHELIIPESFFDEYSTALEEFQKSDSGKAVGRVVELTAFRSNGDEFPIEASLSAVLSANGWQAVGILRDISERKWAEESLRGYLIALESVNKALEQSNMAAEAATRAKSQFLANMSHEIRTPMTAILGYADILINEPGIEKAPPHRRQNLETIKRNGVHLLELINDILDLSKIEAGKMEIERVRCSPFELIAEVTSLMQVRADEKQLKLTTNLTGSLPETVFIDPLRTRQVLVNLLGNAIKFTDHGEIRIVGKCTNDSESPQLCFDVIDMGIGMNEEQISKLFQAFSQVDNSATRKFGGSGLGLCICKRLSEAMGGSIEVHSEPGKGSVFSFTIDPGPLEGIRMIHNGNVTERAPLASSKTNEKIQLHHEILLAEDGPDNQRLIRLVLENAGAKVTTVENGQLAVEAALAACRDGKPFGAILMDMQMPVMDGYAATQELRRQGYTGPIIALTAHAMADDRQKCLDAGCDDFASKPIDWQQLIATVDRWTSPVSDDMPANRQDASSDTATEPEPVLQSTYADNPVISSIIPDFVHGLPERLAAMRATLSAGQLEELCRLAHQLKGAGGSYGYPTLSDIARVLEHDAREGLATEAEASLKKLAVVCGAVIRGLEQHPIHASMNS